MRFERELLKGLAPTLVMELLSRKAMYGYELTTTVRKETNGSFEWKEGSLYPSLHKLERDGLVRGQWQGERGSRRRKYYDLTEAGRVALVTKTQSWRQLCEAINQVLEGSHGRE